MSATDTSQSSSDFLKSSRLPGDFELNSWTHGLGGAPRPNPTPSSPISSQSPSQPSQGSLSFSTGSAVNANVGNTSAGNRYTPQSNPNFRYDQKSPSAAQAAPSNPFVSSSLGQSGDSRPDARGVTRDAWNQTQTSDLQSFDLSTYVQSQARPSPTSSPREYSQTKKDQTLPGAGFNDWGHQSVVSQQSSSNQSSLDQLSVSDTSSAAGEYEDYDNESGSDTYESRFANKKILISVVLVGALVLGGGMSYLYNSYFGKDTDGPTPIVKNAQGPSKVKPTDPGGKQFAHSDSKILGRLNDGSAPAETDPSSETRKVSTLVVGRDGSIQPPAGGETQNATPSVSVPVPGMTLIDGAAPSGKPSSSPSVNVTGPTSSPAKAENSSDGSKAVDVKVSDNAAAKETVPTPTATPSNASSATNTSQVSAASTPSNTPPTPNTSPSPVPAANNVSETSQQAKAEAGPPNPSSNAATKSTLTEADHADPSSQKKVASSPSQTGSAAGSSSTKPKTDIKTASLDPSTKTARSLPPSGVGYVAVLASVPVSGTSRIIALQQYADLQQKYNGILQNKTPDVQEANLGEKGRYHRLVIGPPSSKEAASSVCAQLKSAGYSGCWIMAY